MDNMFRQTIKLLILAAILGLAVNVVSPNRIDFIGTWRDVATGNEPIVPPESEPGDPPFISLNVAQMLHSQKGTLFIDAREIEEFQCGTIPGSICVPFDYLPEEDLQGYFDSVFASAPPFKEIVTFCSGEECDLSSRSSWAYVGRNSGDAQGRPGRATALSPIPSPCGVTVGRSFAQSSCPRVAVR